MSNITRKLGEYRATTYAVDIGEDGDPILKSVAEVTYLATTPDVRHAYPEFAAQGFDVGKHQYVTVELLHMHRFTATLEAFLSVAVDDIID